MLVLYVALGIVTFGWGPHCASPDRDDLGSRGSESRRSLISRYFSGPAHPFSPRM